MASEAEALASEACRIADERVADSAAQLAALKLRLAGARAVVNSTHFHEGGHAAAFMALGQPPDSATIVRTARTLGQVRRDQLTKLTVGELGAISMAGVVAQREYLKRAGLPCDEETLAAAGSADRADVAEMLLANAFDCNLTIFIELATARAATLLEANWPAVERLAAELLERGTLSREQIEAAYMLVNAEARNALG